MPLRLVLDSAPAVLHEYIPPCRIEQVQGGIALDGLYDIFRGGEKIGKVEVLRRGLYYRFRCYCDLTGDVIYRITVQCGDVTENLGIVLPCMDSFWLEKDLPISRFAKEVPVFRAIPRHPAKYDAGLQIKPDEPLCYLNRIRAAHLRLRADAKGYMIKSSGQAPRDSDLIP